VPEGTVFRLWMGKVPGKHQLLSLNPPKWGCFGSKTLLFQRVVFTDEYMRQNYKMLIT
jgi:hypothetical protein